MAMPQVTVDPNSGFCFGVVYAIEMAEDFLNANGQLYCLGDIVHNDMEVDRLQQKGLKTISHEDLNELRDTTVLIRAHGEPPSTYETALRNNITLVDASCPVVLKLQNRVRAAYEPDTQIIIFGKPGHAEVNGLLGQTEGKAVIIQNMEDLDQVDFSKPTVLFSQTTKSTDKFYAIRDEITRRAQEQFKANDTICRQVSNREPQLRVFATRHDVIIFVAGRKSSNGKVLYEVCKAANPQTYFVSEVSEVNPDWYRQSNSVGICGATSTPQWLMEEVAGFIQSGSIPG
ncbi:MAG: 4-hydroxy-3-methylbut-2-enyl diphosphate reductase [Bacteroidetes bacterium]|nr:4-hydroxy-3-methylbut-2-enyl diphosphate reductase [Bacteroidota bacterium]